MRRIKFIIAATIFLLVLSTSWQIASCELANLELRDDMKTVAAMGGSRIGLMADASDEDLREEVVQNAASHGVRLSKNQIVVKRSGTPGNPKIFLSARYQSRVSMPGLSLVFHFTATSR